MKLPNVKALRLTLGWVSVLGCAAIIAAYFGHLVIENDKHMMRTVVGIGFVLAIYLRLGRLEAGQSKFHWFMPWSTIPICLTAIWAANVRLFGDFNVGAALFHMRHSVQYDGLSADIAEGALFLLLSLALVFSVIYLGRRDRRVRWLDKLIALPLLLINPVSLFIYDTYLNPSLKNTSLETYYAVPDLITPKGPQPNILIIYLESLEQTYGEAVFGDAFAKLDQIAEGGLRFNGVHEIQDTGWTIAGMTASHCGIPLLSKGLIMKNRMKNIDTFLPGATCLASTLGRDGYTTVYYGAANLKFAGKDMFLRTHGYTEQRETKDFDPKSRGEIGEWGMYDDALFEQSLARLRTLDVAPAPYLLTVLTLAGHLPEGYPAPKCYDQIAGSAQMDPILLSIRCTGLLLDDFLSQAREEGLLENTVVVVTSDHLAHRNTQFNILKSLDRQNFMVIFPPNGRKGVVNVNASMVDLYPTILELLGYELPEGQFGIGRSMLGEVLSLRESLGPKTLDKLILRDKDLRRRIWSVDRAGTAAP